MNDQEKTCGTCGNYRALLHRMEPVCTVEAEERLSGNYIVVSTVRRAPDHPCHRPEDYERKERR